MADDVAQQERSKMMRPNLHHIYSRYDVEITMLKLFVFSMEDAHQYSLRTSQIHHL